MTDAPQIPGFLYPPLLDVTPPNGRRLIRYWTAPNAPKPDVAAPPDGYEFYPGLAAVPGNRWTLDLRQLPPAPPPVVPLPTPAPPPAPAPERLWGVNVGENVPHVAEFRYKDLIKTVAGFFAPGQRGGAGVPLGPDGWPATDFSVVLIDNATPAHYGDYAVVFEGRATVAPIGGGASVVGVPAFDGTFTRVKIHYSPQAVPSLSLTFGNTSGPRRVRVLRPGVTEADEAAEPLTDAWVAMMKALNPGTVRYMDALQVNSPRSGSWSDRTTPASPSFHPSAGGRAPGMCLEWLIHASNKLRANPWINVPVTADDDYVAQLAAMLAAQLDPSLSAYLERGNEVWNMGLGFGSHPVNVAQAKSLRAARAYDPADEIAGWQHHAAETARWGRVFRAALGGRARPVLCGQGPNLETLSRGLQYLRATGSEPSGCLYAVAVAPYAGITPDLSPDDWRVNLLAGPHVAAFYALAKQWGLKSAAYEAGVDVGGSAAAQSDPRMQALLSAYLSKWEGTAPLMYYRVCSEPASCYGLTNDATVLVAPKFKAAVAYSASLAAH